MIDYHACAEVHHGGGVGIGNRQGIVRFRQLLRVDKRQFGDGTPEGDISIEVVAVHRHAGIVGRRAGIGCSGLLYGLQAGGIVILCAAVRLEEANVVHAFFHCDAEHAIGIFVFHGRCR